MKTVAEARTRLQEYKLSVMVITIPTVVAALTGRNVAGASCLITEKGQYLLVPEGFRLHEPLRLQIDGWEMLHISDPRDLRAKIGAIFKSEGLDAEVHLGVKGELDRETERELTRLITQQHYASTLTTMRH